jgi:hypothetical protein
MIRRPLPGGGVCGFVLALAIALLAPGTVSARPVGFAGVNYAFYPSISAADAGRMARGGVATGRFGLEWFQVQRAQGPYDWSDADETIGNLASHGIEPIPVLFGTPYWATDGALLQPIADLQIPILTPFTSGTAYPPNDTARGSQGWAAFVQAAARRYGPGGSYWQGPYRAEHPKAAPLPIRIWQLWNEPNISYYFWPVPSAAKYGDLVRISHDALTAVDPKAKVALAGLPCRAAYTCARFLDDLYAQPGLRRDFDLVAVHPYGPSVHFMLHEIRPVRDVMDENGDRHTQIWVSEFGWGSDPPGSHYNVGPLGQARLLTKSYKAFRHVRRRLGLWGADWFDWRDSPGAQGTCLWCAHTGLFAADGAPKPAWRAYRRAIHVRPATAADGPRSRPRRRARSRQPVAQG